VWRAQRSGGMPCHACGNSAFGVSPAVAIPNQEGAKPDIALWVVETFCCGIMWMSTILNLRSLLGSQTGIGGFSSVAQEMYPQHYMPFSELKGITFSNGEGIDE
jgi:hypothetical protein